MAKRLSTHAQLWSLHSDCLEHWVEMNSEPKQRPARKQTMIDQENRPWISRNLIANRDQIANICWIIEERKRIPENIYFCFTDCAKAFVFVDHNKLWKILQEKGIPDQITCLLWNLYADQEETVRTGHRTDCFQIGKGVHQGYILSPCLFNLYAEYIMWDIRLEKAQAGIKIARRNINNLRYAGDTTLMAESEEELKSL